MTRREWGLLAWGAVLFVVIGVAAAAGGRDCEVPKSGPFHWLMSGHEYVQRFATASHRSSCRHFR